MRETRETEHTPIVVAGFWRFPDEIHAEEVSQEGIANVLMAAAGWAAEAPCTEEDCEGCNVFRLAYWQLDAVLSPAMRRLYQATLREANTPIVPGPWEEVS